jgi:hypothetical protein
MRYLRNCGFPVLLGLSLIVASAAALGAQRSFVKSTGVDTPPGPGSCSVTSPCRSFASAIDSTSIGGEVIVLDSAGYGPVSIVKSVSIIAPPGVYAGVTVPAGGIGVDVLATGGKVVVQGLTINGTGAGGYVGINFADGAELHVINCTISNFNGGGVSVGVPGSRVFITDTTLRGGVSGIVLAGTVTAVLDRVRMENITAGASISVADGVSLSVRDSVASANFAGIASSASGSTVTRVTIDGTVVADSTGDGIYSQANGAGSRATLDLIRTTLTRNGSTGATVDALSTGTAVMTVTSSLLSENIVGISNGASAGTSTAFASRNSISRNTTAGIAQAGTGIVHTRSNNAGEQVPATLGTITAVPGF